MIEAPNTINNTTPKNLAIENKVWINFVYFIIQELSPVTVVFKDRIL